MGSSILFCIIMIISSTPLILLGIYALKKKEPMHFWAGIKVKSEEISDIKAYNRANGIMWIVFGSIFLLSGVLSPLFKLKILGIIVLIASILGFYALIFIYNRIYMRYTTKR